MPDADRTHVSFDGIALTAGGQDLVLDYSDPDQGGTRLRFRYVISRKVLPRLITGYGPDIGYTGEEIGYYQIPPDVLGDAREWLKSKAEIAHASNKETIASTLLEYLEFLELGQSHSHSSRRNRPENSSPQQSFKW